MNIPGLSSEERRGMSSSLAHVLFEYLDMVRRKEGGEGERQSVGVIVSASATSDIKLCPCITLVLKLERLVLNLFGLFHVTRIHSIR